jgi:molybdopterin-guanine dinucleotide biosynthesis protein A
MFSCLSITGNDPGNNLKLKKDLMKYDAILVAGESKGSYTVCNQYKALLKLNDRYCIEYVIEALQKASSIGDIYVVGLKKRLMEALAKTRIDLNQPKKIHILEQKSTLLENVWHAFLESLPPLHGRKDAALAAFVDKAVLVVPCDSPLITAHEVEHFIANCDLNRHDYILGLTPEKCMQYFYPTEHRPGIKMAYLHMREKNYRINNLHMVRPAKVEHRIHINKMYEYRYQKQVFNMILLTIYLLRFQRLRNFSLILGLQFSLMSAKLGLPRITAIFKRWVPRKNLEKAISHILNTRFASQEIQFPGAALDIDNDASYKALESEFEHWRSHLTDLKRNSEHIPPGLSGGTENL